MHKAYNLIQLNYIFFFVMKGIIFQNYKGYCIFEKFKQFFDKGGPFASDNLAIIYINFEYLIWREGFNSLGHPVRNIVTIRPSKLKSGIVTFHQHNNSSTLHFINTTIIDNLAGITNNLNLSLVYIKTQFQGRLEK